MSRSGPSPSLSGVPRSGTTILVLNDGRGVGDESLTGSRSICFPINLPAANDCGSSRAPK